MRFIRLLLAVVLAGFLVPGIAGAGPVPEQDDCVFVQRVNNPQKHEVVCYTTEDEEGDWPDASACVYDRLLQTVIPDFDGLGKLACARTQEFAYLGTPGVCLYQGPDEYPAGCVLADKGFDNDHDGDIDETKHCIVWVAGSSFCWYD